MESSFSVRRSLRTVRPLKPFGSSDSPNVVNVHEDPQPSTRKPDAGDASLEEQPGCSLDEPHGGSWASESDNGSDSTDSEKKTTRRKKKKRNDDDPDYMGDDSDDQHLSEEEYGIDSDPEASHDSGSNDDEDWDGEGFHGEPSLLPRKMTSSNGFHNGVGAELEPWLKTNFRLSYNSSAIIPRSQLYAKYERFCAENSMGVVNSACLGKVLRRTFPGVDTRRLGRRGESKYHYIGLEFNPGADTPANDDPPSEARRVSATYPDPARVKRMKTKNPLLQILATLEESDRVNVLLQVLSSLIQQMGAGHTTFIPELLKQDHAWTLLPAVSEVEALELGFSQSHVRQFVESFRIHLGMIAHCMTSAAFLALPEIFRNFWDGRETSLQVNSPGLLADNDSWLDPVSFRNLTTWGPVHRLVIDGYLYTLQRLVEQFTSNFKAAIGGSDGKLPLPNVLNATGAFSAFLDEFVLKFPCWILLAVRNLNVKIAETIHACAAAFCKHLHQVMGLSRAYSLLQPMTCDQRKSDFLGAVFQQLLPSWEKVIINGLDKHEYQDLKGFVEMTTIFLSQPDTLTLWRGWIHETIHVRLNGIQQDFPAESFDRSQLWLKQFLQLWITICKRLGALARTEIRPIGRFECIEPVFWLLDFFNRFVRYSVEYQLAVLNNEFPIVTSYKAVVGDCLSSACAVSLTLFADHLVEDLQFITPTNREFFSKSAELQPFLPPEEDRDVPEKPAEAEMEKEPVKPPADSSLLELLLR